MLNLLECVAAMNIQNVLLVDDDQNLRRIGRMALERVGHWNVVVASSGPEAIELAGCCKPDVILLDVMMPGMDGTEALSLLKQNKSTAGIPVILMTAKVQTHELNSYLNLGASGVIAKPFDPLKLPADISRILLECVSC